MAADSRKRLLTCVVFFLLQVLVSSSSAGCIDGTYEHKGKECCRCGAGMRVEEHCTTNSDKSKCVHCESGRYSSHPSGQETCEPCTSCTQPSDNLEEAEPCTRGRDSKCRCKKDHYCISGTETCKLCHPCKECGDEGIKVPCRGYNNTVCNDKTGGGNEGGIIAGVILGIIGLIAVIVAVYILKRKYISGCREICRRERDDSTVPKQVGNGHSVDVEMQPLNVPDVDLQPFLPDIAEQIGFIDMQEIAMRSNISSAIIDSFKLDNPGNSQEQTLQLLRHWVESQGRKAGKNLIKMLQKSGKRGKAEKVADILSTGN